MRNLARTLAALLLGALSVFAAGLPASAVTDECVPASGTYSASGVCAITVTKAEAVCLNGVVSLSYAVTTTPSSASTVGVTWVNPAGPNLVQASLPLTGTVTWPASIPKVAVDVQLVAGTVDATVRVDPTSANATCTSSQVLSVSSPTSSRVLSATGAEVVPFVAVGGGLLVVGVGLLLTRAARLRRAAAEE